MSEERDLGQSMASIARELGIKPNRLYRLREEMLIAGEKAFPRQGSIKASDKELHNLKKELARVKHERDILKKAINIFSKDR